MSMTDTGGSPNSWIDSQGTSGGTDIVTALQGMTRLLSSLVKIFQGTYVTGTFTMAAAASTTVSQPSVKSGATILLTPTNASAATLVGSVKAPYISSIAAGVSFAVSTANSTNAAGTETFSYFIKNP